MIQPHYPYQTDDRKFKYYLNRVQPYFDEQLFDHPFLSERKVVPGEDASRREITRAVAAYYGMIETADQHFGRVVQALEDAGQDLDDWIVIYTSDHGEMLGEHNIWEKQKFFEGSVRVPLVIRFPAQFTQRTIDRNVSICDLFATICDLTGIPVPGDLDSRSLVPMMSGDDTEWDNESVSFFYAGGNRNLMIKQDHLKYQSYQCEGEDRPEVLFDLQQDPSENSNFIDDEQYRGDVERFRARKRELGYP